MILEDALGGYQVSRLEHSLQIATRAETNSADKQMIAAEFAASVLQPYVREERDKFKTHRWYRSCAKFCERWDQGSFDPSYKTLPLSYFEPVVREVFSRPLQ